jgi:2-(1,2-epoxy-1,2-dihydrophenyl)acetyl-CoA isomerase
MTQPEDTPALVLTERRDGVLTITLNRPEKLNTLNVGLVNALAQALAAEGTAEGVRAIVLAGAGRAFCAGDEFGAERSPAEQRSLARSPVQHYVAGPGRWTTVIKTMRSLTIPVVARIQGYAYGAGLDLALAADFRVMAEDAKLAAPFVKRGISTGANLLHEYVGVGRALEITLLGEPIEAPQALSLGLTTRVVPPEELESGAAAFAEHLASGATGAVGLTKLAVYQSWGQDLDTALRAQATSWMQGLTLEDRAEGVTAFREHRDPEFRGR